MTTKLVPAEVRNRATVRDVTHTELALSAWQIALPTAAEWIEYLEHAALRARNTGKFLPIASMGAKDYGATD